MIKKAGIRIGKQDCRGMKRSPDEPLRNRARGFWRRSGNTKSTWRSQVRQWP